MLHYGRVVSKVGGQSIDVILLKDGRLIHPIPNGPTNLKHLVVGDLVELSLEHKAAVDGDADGDPFEDACSIECGIVRKADPLVDLASSTSPPPTAVAETRSMSLSLTEMAAGKSLYTVWPGYNFLPIGDMKLGSLPPFGVNSLTVLHGSIRRFARGSHPIAKSWLRCDVQFHDGLNMEDVAVLATSLQLSPSIFRACPREGLLLLAKVSAVDVVRADDGSDYSDLDDSDKEEDDNDASQKKRLQQGDGSGLDSLDPEALPGCRLLLLGFIGNDTDNTCAGVEDNPELSPLPLDQDLVSGIFRLPKRYGNAEEDALRYRSLLAKFCRACAPAADDDKESEALTQAADILQGEHKTNSVHIGCTQLVLEAWNRDCLNGQVKTRRCIPLSEDGHCSIPSRSSAAVTTIPASTSVQKTKPWEARPPVNLADDRACSRGWNIAKVILKNALSSMVQVELPAPERLHKTCLRLLELDLLERFVDEVVMSSQATDDISLALFMLKAVGRKVKKLLLSPGFGSHSKFDFESRLLSLRQLLEDASERQSRERAEPFSRPAAPRSVHDNFIVPDKIFTHQQLGPKPTTRSQGWIGNLNEFDISFPKSRGHAGIERERREVVDHLQQLMARFLVGDIDKEALKTRHQELAWVVLQVELYLFELSQHLEEDTFGMLEAEVMSLEAVLEHYLKLSALLWEMVEHQVERRSREVLCGFIVCCLVHAASSARWPTLGKFDLALNPQALHPLVLLETLPRAVVRRVHAYLLRCTRSQQPLFCLEDEEPTLKFALQFASEGESPESARLREIHADEKADAQKRIEGHWKQVRHQQELAAKLKIKIDELETERKIVQEKYYAAKEVEDAVRAGRRRVQLLRGQLLRAGGGHFGAFGGGGGSDMEMCTRASLEAELAAAEQELACAEGRERALPKPSKFWGEQLNRLREQLEDARRQLRLAEIPPPAVYQPLPADEQKAQQALFFLFMPALLRALANLSFWSQQLTRVWTPAQWAQTSPTFATSFATSWVTYYQTMQVHNNDYHKPARIHQGSDGLVSLHSDEKSEPESEVNADIIYDLTDPNMAVWYPDRFNLRFAWRSAGRFPGDGPYVNPHAEQSPEAVVNHFTDTLDRRGGGRGANHHFQQFMAIHDTIDESRGNLGMASQNDRPQHWPLKSYLSFCDLRAYPRQQLRNLCVAINERSLEWADERVFHLLRQCLGHIGELGENSELSWWDDLALATDARGAMESALSDLVSEHCSKRCSHPAIPAVALLTGFFAQDTAALTRSCMELATTTFTWAEELKLTISEASGEEKEDARSKQCLFCIYSMLAFWTTTLDTNNVRLLAKAIVLARHGLHYGAASRGRGEQGERGEMATLPRLEKLSREVIVKHLNDIVRLAEDDTSICTEAARCANEEVPRTLTWSRKEGSACFEARSRHVYTLNLLDGTLLVDGRPPERLPLEALQHPLYKRVFGEVIFDVRCLEPGRFRTTMHFDGRFYEFVNAGFPEMVINEIIVDDSGREHVLKLEDPRNCGNVPLRLLDLCSQWVDIHEKLLLFRPLDFRKRDIQWIYHLPTKECIRIPPHLSKGELDAKKLWSDQQIKDMLVPGPRTLIPIWSKFEDPKYIHSFADRHNGSLQTVEFPRYKLTFQKDGDKFKSLDYHGFELAAGQQLLDFLPDFKTYLVLSKVQGGHEIKKLLVPDGQVVQGEKAGDWVYIRGSNKSGAERAVLQFDEHHRFRTFQAESLEARLQLAALHLAAGPALPDRRGQTVGVESARILLRQSWTNRPLTGREFDKLLNAMDLAHNKNYPGCEILCHDLALSSVQVKGLHHNHPHFYRIRQIDSNTSQNLAARYSQEVLLESDNPRRHLTWAEVSRVVSMMAPISDGIPSVAEESRVRLPKCPVPESIVKDCEAWQKTCLQPAAEAASSRPFPLRVAANTEMARTMDESLRESWEAHSRELADEKVVKPDCKDPQLYGEKLKEVSHAVEQVQAYVRKCLETYPRTEDSISSAFRVRLATHLAPKPSMAELVQAACERDESRWLKHLTRLNPFLERLSAKRLRKALLLLLQLFVLEDKFRRLLQYAESREVPLLLQELQVYRSWDVKDHPEWLAFEVEGGLQIRPVQYDVAKHLINHPGDIVQLNMGEGKTRVIVPMLILHWADETHLLRVTVLSSLIDELAAFLQRNLTASILDRKVFLMPFDRDVKLTGWDDLGSELKRTLEYCQKQRGVLLVSPSHRLSLKLKWQEALFNRNSQVCRAIEQLDEMNVRDLIDESDEVLHHKWQLIYAIGNHLPLPDGVERWTVAEALLRSLQRCLRKDGFVAKIPTGALVHSVNEGGAFDEVRLLPGPPLQEFLPTLKTELVDDILKDPPFDFLWLKAFNNARIDEFRSFILKRERSIDDLPATLPDDQKAVLLALRGFMACGIFEHCMEKRHQVNFGVNPVGKKRLAVPFRAANTPAERSEYGHPDVALLLTLLSYYYSGLSKNQVLEAFKKLLGKGQTEKAKFYRVWFELSRATMSVEEAAKLDDYRKLDTTDESTQLLLAAYFSRNYETINFWLNEVVFPPETKQYPSKLVGNAWHLADNSEKLVNGFSGTDDNQWLLPAQVQQQALPKLVSTNGKMIDLVLKNPTYRTLEDRSLLLEDVVAHVEDGVKALIDCGALTVGTTNLQIANRLLELLPVDTFPGVTFWHAETKEWTVVDRKGRVLPLHRSPLQAKQTFAFFDEAHARGADLKLDREAVAVVTVGPKTGKDKLMQAAGRMRMLDKGQKLQFVGPRDVTQKIREVAEALLAQPGSGRRSALARPAVEDSEDEDEDLDDGASGKTEDSSGETAFDTEEEAEESSSDTQDDGKADRLTSKHLLEWVMHNTINSNEQGLVEWANQGAVFATTAKELSSFTKFEESMELKGFYGEKLEPKQASEIVEKALSFHEQRIAAERSRLKDDERKLLQSIRAQADKLGGEVEVMAAAHDEEYERELEKEVERIEEVQRTVVQYRPCRERDWFYEELFDSSNLGDLVGTVQTIALHDVIKRTTIRGDKDTWPCGIVCTQNFADTVYASSPMCDVLRRVNMVVKLPSGECLLTAPRESDNILRIASEKLKTDSELAITIASFHYWCRGWEASQSARAKLPRLSLTSLGTEGTEAFSSSSHLSSVISIGLFAAETEYPSDLLKSKLPQALSDSRPEDPRFEARVSVETCKALVNRRDHETLYDRSDLHEALMYRDAEKWLQDQTKFTRSADGKTITWFPSWDLLDDNCKHLESPNFDLGPQKGLKFVLHPRGMAGGRDGHFTWMLQGLSWAKVSLKVVACGRASTIKDLMCQEDSYTITKSVPLPESLDFSEEKVECSLLSNIGCLETHPAEPDTVRWLPSLGPENADGSYTSPSFSLAGRTGLSLSLKVSRDGAKVAITGLEQGVKYKVKQGRVVKKSRNRSATFDSGTISADDFIDFSIFAAQEDDLVSGSIAAAAALAARGESSISRT